MPLFFVLICETENGAIVLSEFSGTQARSLRYSLIELKLVVRRAVDDDTLLS